MALTYGFYNSSASDRAYNATQMSSLFDGIIQDGIFSSILDRLMVIPQGSGLQVIVGTGRAWFNHTWTLNDAPIILTHDAPHVSWARYDAVILEVDSDIGVRANSIKIIKGTASVNPIYPVLQKSGTLYQYALAYVHIPVGLTTISAANITNKVGTSECPYVTSPITSFNINELIAQWDSEWSQWSDQKQLEFDTWFENIIFQLSQEAEGNLQNQINSILATINAKVIARQGGNATDWTFGGINNYTPIDNAAIQVGVGYIYGSIGRMTITFPLPYTYPPLIYLTAGGSIYESHFTGRVVSITTTGFVAEFMEHVIGAPYHRYAPQLTLSGWLAIGPKYMDQ